MIKGILFYLLIGMCEAAIGLDGLVGEHILGFIGYTFMWLPMDIWFAIKVLMHPGECIFEDYNDD